MNRFIPFPGRMSKTRLSLSSALSQGLFECVCMVHWSQFDCVALFCVFLIFCLLVVLVSADRLTGKRLASEITCNALMGTLNPTHSLSSSSLLSIGVDRKKMFFGYTFGGGVVKPGVICGESRPVKEQRKVVISGLHSGSSRSEPDCGYACSVAVCCRHRKQIELSAWITDPYVMPAGAWPISQLPAVVRQRHCGRR